LDGKFFGALLNGLIKRRFYRESEFTVDFLKQRLFTNSRLTNDKIVALISECDRMLTQAASEDWTLDTLQRQLLQTDISKEHSDVFSHIWKAERTKIHNSLLMKSSWTPTLSSFTWRIDLKTQQKSILQQPPSQPSQPSSSSSLTDPVAIVELILDNKSGLTQQAADTTVLQFEVDRRRVNTITNQISQIQQIIDQFA